MRFFLLALKNKKKKARSHTAFYKCVQVKKILLLWLIDPRTCVHQKIIWGQAIDVCSIGKIQIISNRFTIQVTMNIIESIHSMGKYQTFLIKNLGCRKCTSMFHILRNKNAYKVNFTLI